MRDLLVALENAEIHNERLTGQCFLDPKSQKEEAPVPQPALKLQKNCCAADDPSKPDYIATHFYGTVLFDQGKYRMWYYGLGTGDTDSGFTVGPVCYAESEDGIQWSKPNLRQLEYKGSLDNNAVKLPGEQMYGGHLIKDEREPDPQQR